MEKYGKIIEKGETIDLFTVLLILFILVASIVGYTFYLKEKHIEYSQVKSGLCPKCEHRSIELIDIRGSGCSPKIVTYRCYHCGYENSFTESSSCRL